MSYSDSEVVMRSLAGLGLLFFGIKMTVSNLSAIAGDQVRRSLQAASRRSGMAMLLGIGAGFVTQSGRTTSFIVASFVQAGLIEVRRALPIVLWANLGCILVISSAVFPIYLLVLFVIAVAGMCIAFEKPKPLLNTASAAFGLALMLYGLQMMSSGAAVLTTYPWFATVLALIRTSLVFAFLMGLVLTLIAQSHMAILLITVTMATRGILNFEETLMVIAGAHLGAGVITYVTGIHFRGQPRQLVTAQTLYNLIGAALLLAVIAADHLAFGRIGLLERGVKALSTAPGTDAAIAAVLINTLTPIMLTLLIELFYRLCVHLAPPLREEGLAHTQFLREEVTGNPMATLPLAEREQLRLLERLPIYLAWARGGSPPDGPSPAACREAFCKISPRIEQFQNALMSERMTAEETEWLLNQKKRQEILAALDETCFEFYIVAKELSDAVGPMRDSMVEGMDALILTAISGMTRGDEAELEQLETMTRNRGPAMERTRMRYLSLSDALPPAQRSLVLEITNLFERLTWSLHRFAALLRASAALVTPFQRPATSWAHDPADPAAVSAQA